MRKLLIATIATIAMTSVAFADNYPRHHHNRHNNNGAIVGGLLGGIIIGSMIAGSNRGYYYDERPRYRYRQCYRSFEGEYWNGYRWVAEYRTICN